MHEHADSWVAGLVSSPDAEASETFDVQLAESSTLVFRVAYSVLRNREDAEDVAQEAFVRAHQSIRQLRDRDRFRAWVVRMTWRLALDRRRGETRRASRELAAPIPDRPPSTEQALIAEERSTRLWGAIDTLPEKLRLVIVLSAIEDQALADVATLLGVPVGTVKSRLFEARKRLQEKLS